MKIERTKNTVAGALWGNIEKLLHIILPFVVRTILIKRLGVEYLGLSGLFTSILSVLSLTELGFGTAAVYAMYKPIAQDDDMTVCAILCYLKKVYRIIGIVILVVGFVLLPFIPKLIAGNIPSDINIYLLYLIYLGNTSISYFLFAYKSSILNATQENKIISKIGFMTSSILYACQIFALLIYPNYYVYIIFIPIITIINNLTKAIIVNKRYPQFLKEALLEKSIHEEMRKRIFPLMSTKLAGVVVNSADTIVISAFLGLSEVAKYNNYYYIMSSVMGFMLVIYSSMQAGIGNALVVDQHEKIMKDFKKLCFINTWMVTFCSVCLLCLYQRFIKLWLGNEMILPFGMVVLFVIYFYANTIQRIVVIYKDAAGIWKEDMLRCYLSCTMNLIINIVTVKIIGLYGVIGSSVIANLLGLPWMGYILYKTVFKESARDFYLDELKGVAVAGCVCTVNYYICSFIREGVIGFIVTAISCIFISNFLLLLIYGRSRQFKESVTWIMVKFKRDKVVAK